MSDYHFSAKVISRSTGRCATAAAAYRSGQAIEDERTGQTFDYQRKQGVVWTAVILPDHAPDWMQDRSALWNAVEMAERRNDALLAREFVIALPYELTRAQQIALIQDFVNDNFTARGMAADVALHAPPRGGDERNWHAHVMTTTRAVENDGLAAKKDRSWNSRAQLVTWREAWADHANDALERAGRDERIDHRSYADQGIDKEPTRHEGPTVTEMRRDGKAHLSEVANDNDERRERNRVRELMRDVWQALSRRISQLRSMLGLAPPVEDYLEAKAREQAHKAREADAERRGTEVEQRLEELREWHLERRRAAQERDQRDRRGTEKEEVRTPEADHDRSVEKARRKAAREREEIRSEPEREDGDQREADKEKAATDSREARKEEPEQKRARSRRRDDPERDSPHRQERGRRRRRRRERGDRGRGDRDGRGGRDDDDRGL